MNFVMVVHDRKIGKITTPPHVEWNLTCYFPAFGRWKPMKASPKPSISEQDGHKAMRLKILIYARAGLYMIVPKIMYQGTRTAAI